MTVEYSELRGARLTAAEFTATNPVIPGGVIGQEKDNPHKVKLGDGSTAWNDLPYLTAGRGSGTSWTANVIGTAKALWDTANGGGTWKFPDSDTGATAPGVISQPDPTADAMLTLLAALPSLDSIIEADVRFPTGQDVATRGLAVVAVDNVNAVSQGGSDSSSLVGMGISIRADGAGDGAGYGLQRWIDGEGSTTPRAIAGFGQDEWHTLKVVTSEIRRLLYLDGVYIGADTKDSGGNQFEGETPLKTADLFGVAAVGLVDFRNITVWTQTFPV